MKLKSILYTNFYVFCSRKNFSTLSYSELRVLSNKDVVKYNTYDIIKLSTKFKFINVDIGTGDAKFVYRLAKKNPQGLFIGIDSNVEGMCEVSAKANKKISKGGLEHNNLLLIASNVQEIPEDFINLANQVTINYPWGSLLKIVTDPDVQNLKKIFRIGKNSANIKLALNKYIYKDKALIKRENLCDLTDQKLDTLKDIYKQIGAISVLYKYNTKEPLDSTWGKQLFFGNRENLEIDIYLRSNFWQDECQITGDYDIPNNE